MKKAFIFYLFFVIFSMAMQPVFSHVPHDVERELDLCVSLFVNAEKNPFMFSVSDVETLVKNGARAECALVVDNIVFDFPTLVAYAKEVIEQDIYMSEHVVAAYSSGVMPIALSADLKHDFLAFQKQSIQEKQKELAEIAIFERICKALKKYPKKLSAQHKELLAGAVQTLLACIVNFNDLQQTQDFMHHHVMVIKCGSKEYTLVDCVQYASQKWSTLNNQYKTILAACQESDNEALHVAGNFFMTKAYAGLMAAQMLSSLEEELQSHHGSSGDQDVEALLRQARQR